MKKTIKLLSVTMLAGIGITNYTNAQNIQGASQQNFILKFTNTSATAPTAGNSLIFDNATNIGIGYGAAGSYKLDVNGDLNTGGSSVLTTNALRLGTNKILWHNGKVSNIFVGVGAGTNSTGLYNTFMGNNAGTSNITGMSNTFMGFEAGKTNTVDGNTAIGYQALANNSVVIFNTAIGYQAMYNITNCGTCFQNAGTNTAVGYQALYNTQAYGACALGYEAALANTTGCSVVAIGETALFSNTTGDDNVAVGGSSCAYNQTGKDNTCVGDGAGRGISPSSYSYNSFFGSNAGFKITTGSDNAFIGRNAGFSNSSGSLNTFVGDSSGYKNTTGGSNVLMGFESGLSNTTGGSNTAIGGLSLITNTTGSANTATGYQALYLNSTGTNNIGVGENAGYSNTSGTYNTFVGEAAGATNTVGRNNTFLGNGADANAGNYTNATAIGTGAITTATNMLYLGNANAKIYCALGMWSGSDGRFKTNVQENVKGLQFIKKLRPVTYNMNTKALDDFEIQNMPDSIKARHRQGMDFAPSMAVVHSGFIAQEVEVAAQQAGFTSSIVNAPDNNNSHYALNYSEIVVPLVKSVQELSKTIDSLNAKVASQDSINAANKIVQNTQQAQIAMQNGMLQTMQSKINQLDSIINACCSNKPQQKSHSNINSNTSDVKLSDVQAIVLDQNVPNPFAEQTTINYNLTDDVGKAQMLFYNASGKLIQSVELTQRGQGQLNVFAENLTDGMYTYTLVVDGRIFATKKMVKQ